MHMRTSLPNSEAHLPADLPPGPRPSRHNPASVFQCEHSESSPFALFGLTPKAKGNIRAIQMTVNWRCMEYEQLIAQVMYLLPTWSDATSMLIAWAELYQNLRFVAPTRQSIQRTFQLYTPCPPPMHGPGKTRIFFIWAGLEFLKPGRVWVRCA